MNDYKNALADFEVSLQFDSKAYRTHYYMGIVYSITKEYEKACECFNTSLEINPFQAHTNFRLAMAYYELQEYEKSMSALNTAIKLGMEPDECKVLNDKLVKKFGLSM